MKKLALASILSGLFAATSANAVIIDNSTPIPDANVLLNFNNSWLDWVYAGPIGPNEFAPGNIQPASYRVAEGWRVATAAEWAARPNWDDFIVPMDPCGITGSPQGGYTNHACYLFASEYWGDFSHVDQNDYAAGRVTDGVNGGPLGGVPETIYVRDSVGHDAPEPVSLALFGLGLAGLAAARRRKIV